MIYNKNKNGMVFYYLLPVVLLIGYVALSVVISSQENGIFDQEFSLVKNLDNIQSFSMKEKIFLETYMNRFLETSKSKFLEEKIETNLVNSNFEQDERNHIGCRIYGDIYFYNEKNIKEGDTDNSNAYCLKDTNLKFDSEYQNYISAEIQRVIKVFLQVNKVTLESVNVEIIETGEIKVDIETKDSFENEFGKLSQSRSYEFRNKNSALENLISDLYKYFYGFSDKINEEILLCYKETLDIKKEDLEIYCISKMYQNSLTPEFKEKYEVKIFENENFEDESYLNLRFKIINKVNNKVELEFSSLFENKIPLGVLDYTLEELTSAENSIKLTLKDLDSNIVPEKYVVIYSYKNFLDKDTYSNYEDLIAMLKESNLDEKLDNFITLEDDKVNYYNSKKDSNLDLSVLITSKDKFDENSEKDLLLYQIYNPETNSFELFDSNKEIYFLVFAVGSKDNYYSNEELLNSNFKSINVNNNFGPNVLVPLENTKIQTSFQGSDQWFDFQISNYYEKDAISYDLYIFKDSEIKTLDKNGCSNYNSNLCEKVSSTELIDLNGDFLVISSSNFTLEDVKNYKYVFKLNTLILEPNNKYNFLLIPIDSSGNGNLVTRSKEYLYSQRFIGTQPNRQSYFIRISNPSSLDRVTTFFVNMQ